MVRRKNLDLEMQGKEVIRLLGGQELVQMVTEINNENIRKAGGVAAWDALSEEEEKTCYIQVEHTIIMHVGREAFEKLLKKKPSRCASIYMGRMCNA